jgi:calcineurin-like phosphoesterase family protein
VNDIWIISDKHLGHQMLSDEGYRPLGFSDAILENLGLKPGDTLIDLGDLHFGRIGHEMHQHFMRVARDKVGREGRLILVRGNHDSRSLPAYCRDGWDWACDGLALDYDGKRLWFSHAPVQEGTFDFNIHGHCHANNHRPELQDGRHILISMEKLHYRPIQLRTILSLKGATPAWIRGKFLKDRA